MADPVYYERTGPLETPLGKSARPVWRVYYDDGTVGWEVEEAAPKTASSGSFPNARTRPGVAPTAQTARDAARTAKDAVRQPEGRR